ncbi:nuclear transport factor 2 family protein [Chitinophaga lutea]
MTMKSFLFPFFFLTLFYATPASAQASEEEAVKSAIRQMFDGMRKGDSAMVKGVFSSKIILQSISRGKDGQVEVRALTADKFLQAVGSPHTDVWDERIEFGTILIDGELASVWTPYRFYLGEKFSHCGVNSFQLGKTAEGWKILYLVDTRRKEGCL